MRNQLHLHNETQPIIGRNAEGCDTFNGMMQGLISGCGADNIENKEAMRKTSTFLS
jgi:hypothetical protein